MGEYTLVSCLHALLRLLFSSSVEIANVGNYNRSESPPPLNGWKKKKKDLNQISDLKADLWFHILVGLLTCKG